MNPAVRLHGTLYYSECSTFTIQHDDLSQRNQSAYEADLSKLAFNFLGRGDPAGVPEA